MTKFERAKKQTLERWTYLLDDILGYKSIIKSCGFCVEYECSLKGCQKCPIYKLEGRVCAFTNTYNNIFSAVCKKSKTAIPLILAVLTYIWSLEDVR